MAWPKLRRILFADTLLLLTACLLSVAVLSLRWRMVHDAPILMYLALLMDKFGYIPYRDFLDVNLPGTYWIYMLLGRATGYSDVGFRIADLLYLAGVSALTWLWMREFGKKVAWVSVLFLGLLYFSHGPMMSFQREYLILLPLMGALVAAVCIPKRYAGYKYFASGLLFGVAATIKPQAALGLPVLLVFQAWGAWRDHALKLKQISLLAGMMTLGFVIPVGATVMYLWRVGALPSFIAMAQNWWPLNINITNDVQILHGPAFIKYLWSGYSAGVFTLWLIPMSIGTWLTLSSPVLSASTKRRVWLLLGLALCYSLYTLLAGKFFFYHWFIYACFVTQIAALCFVEMPAAAPLWRSLMPLLLLWVLPPLLLAPPIEIAAAVFGLEMPPIQNGRVDEIATFLKANLQAGQTVQPLDWTGGAIHAMLLAQAPLATPVVYDVIFYQDTTSVYVQSWRQRFMTLMQTQPPEFIIEIETNKPWISGPNTTRHFPELRKWMQASYAIALRGDGYSVWQHNP